MSWDGSIVAILKVVKLALPIVVLASCVFIAGCEVLGGVVGAGVGAAVKKDQDSEVSETFTHPLPRTKSAVLAALKRMRIEVASSEGERIKGKTKDDPVDVKLEAVTEKTTRMTVKIGEGFKKDRATAQEIVDQTKKSLGEAK
jgi:hypothetical protein